MRLYRRKYAHVNRATGRKVFHDRNRARVNWSCAHAQSRCRAGIGQVIRTADPTAARSANRHDADEAGGPNVLVMAAQASVGLIETYFVGKLGTNALAGVALGFPVVMLM